MVIFRRRSGGRLTRNNQPSDEGRTGVDHDPDKICLAPNPNDDKPEKQRQAKRDNVFRAEDEKISTTAKRLIDLGIFHRHDA